MKEEPVSQPTQYTLLNTSNFNKTLTCSLPDILNKYVSLISEYESFISEKVNIKNKKYYEFIFNRGLDTISHVFQMILFYTKNLDITYYHSQKSFYFYVEFIEQIIDIQHSFLQLSSRDASVFVYKKTIYEINNEYRKSIESLNSTKDSNIESIGLYIEFYKLLVGTPRLKEIGDIINPNSSKYDRETIILLYMFIEKVQDNDLLILLLSKIYATNISNL